MKKAVGAVLVALATLPAAAADSLYEEGLSFRLGGFQSNAETRLRLDAANGALGTSLSLEDDLGYSDSEFLPVFDAVWRINPRHRVELGYLRFGRDAQKTISGEIRFGDQVFPVSSEVNSQFDSDVWRLTYGWSFYREGGNELALLLGLHTTKFTTRLETTSGSIAEAAERTIPLPTLGLQGSWALSPSWRINGAVQVFSLEYGDYEGSFTTGSLAAEYRINRNFAVGAGYMLNDYNLEVTKGKARGSFDYQFDGPMVYVTGGF
jgi:hypothetical protein